MSEVKNSDSHFTFPRRITSFFFFFFLKKKYQHPRDAVNQAEGGARRESAPEASGSTHTCLIPQPGTPLKLPEVRCFRGRLRSESCLKMRFEDDSSRNRRQKF